MVTRTCRSDVYNPTYFNRAGRFFLMATWLTGFRTLTSFPPLYFFCVCKLMFSARVVDVVSYVKLLVPISVATKRRTENRCLIILFIFVINNVSSMNYKCL